LRLFGDTHAFDGGQTNPDGGEVEERSWGPLKEGVPSGPKGGARRSNPAHVRTDRKKRFENEWEEMIPKKIDFGGGEWGEKISTPAKQKRKG